MKWWLISILFSVFTLNAQSFEDRQLRFERVREAEFEKDSLLKIQFEHRLMNYPPYNVYLRAFKEERILEVWVQNGPGDHYQKLRDYPFCKMSGYLGPKRKQGDEQIPEGFYFIDRFNPTSNFFLSLGVNYPNKVDRKLSDAKDLGGAIYIHGDCETIGCIPITDDYIKELYWLCVKSTDNGQAYIPIHIFPYRFATTSNPFLYEDQKIDTDLHEFWDNLKRGYYFFEEYRQPPSVHIDKQGKYHFY